MSGIRLQMPENRSAQVWSQVQVWCMRQMRRWAWAFAGAVLGVCSVMGLASDVWQAHDQAQQAFDAAQQALQAQPQTTQQPQEVQVAAHAAGGLWSRLPHRVSPDTPTKLQQALQAQGLTVVSLRTLSASSGGALQSQNLALRLHGDFAEWARAFQAWTASGPVVSIERLVVVPLATAQKVQLDVVLRLWFKTGTDGSDTWPAWPIVAAAMPVNEPGEQGHGVFALAGGPDSKLPVLQPVGPEALTLTDDPMTWPVERIRVLGTWQEGERWQAVLSAGGVWVPVRVGQRVSRQAHRVQAIGRDALILRTSQGQNIALNVAGGGR
jgi:hypothetical protein